MKKDQRVVDMCQSVGTDWVVNQMKKQLYRCNYLIKREKNPILLAERMQNKQNILDGIEYAKELDISHEASTTGKWLREKVLEEKK